MASSRFRLRGMGDRRRIRAPGWVLLAILWMIPAVRPASGFADDEAAVTGSPPKGGAFMAEVESGFVWQTRNDVQVPNDATGTRFSLLDILGKSASGPTVRGQLAWNVAPRHAVRIVLAPLEVEGSDVLTERTDFAGTRFEPGERVLATYRFDSWRATYRWRFRETPRSRAWVGVTAKIRDAEIRVRSEDRPDRDAREANVGFVPLLHAAAAVRLGRSMAIDLELDALAGGPGRAEDLAVRVRRDLGGGWSASLGYRTLEGGADVDDVYNFAWLHWAVVSVVKEF